ncbi:MAG: 50S ribosomal protein L23 [Desulfobacterales bacterium]|nr:50S ribosomal protein L23 [Desulfobacterales bacterium]
MINYDIIKRPINTEKTNLLKEISNKICVEVKKDANRIEIKKAMESLFNVKVLSVKTISVKGKTKRRGRILGKRRDFKKAIIGLMPGERIDFFDGI